MQRTGGEKFSESDTRLLPYWLAGRVSDEVHHQAFELLGQEDDLMRDILAVGIHTQGAPITARERDALLCGYPDTSLRALLAEVGVKSRPETEEWVRCEWRFESTIGTRDEFEREILAAAEAAKGTLAVNAVSRIDRNGVQARMYVSILDSSVERQTALWQRIKSALTDLRLNRRDGRSLQDVGSLFESIRLGWDWPVYYRDMVANSRLIWSASGEEIDLRALAGNQPRDD